MESNKNIDIVFCSVPPMSLDRAPGAPALLKSATIEAGYTAIGIDLSINFFINQCNKDIDYFNELTSIFRPAEEFSDKALVAAEEWLAQSIALLQLINPLVIGISVFTVFQHRASYRLLQAIRQHIPHTKIIVGGYGLAITANSMAKDRVKKIELVKPFHQFLTDNKLCDFVVLDGGINQLVDILHEIIPHTVELGGELYQEHKVLYNTPIPNYDDYTLSNYVWNDKPSLPITGSKGCVRSCVFCDVPGQFGKFKYRTGIDIANEMIYLHKQYNVTLFEFTDSLVNGSLLAFREWLEIIADYNDQQLDENKLHWFGQYICRPQSKALEKTYPLMVRSGVTNLTIGVESGSNKVLEAMKKGMTVEDVYGELKIFKQYGIKCHLLMLSGFYNETFEYFLETLNFIINCYSYAAYGTITKLSMGAPLYINNKMYLSEAADRLGILIDPLNDLNWKVTSDSTYDFAERCRRRLITQILLDKLGIPISESSIVNLRQVLQLLIQYKEELVTTLHDSK